jgi:hypothetical protein
MLDLQAVQKVTAFVFAPHVETVLKWTFNLITKILI